MATRSTDATPAPAGATSRALGTSVHVVVTGAEHLATAKAAVDDVVAGIDRCCSRFRDDSEISRLHARAGGYVPVSPLLLAALRAALRGAQLSDGAVDPTVGTAVTAIGYDGDFASIAADGGAIALTVKSVPGWRCIRVDEATSSVLIPNGVELDLGSTAKALAADLAAAAALAAMDGGGVLVNLGGDIAVAGEAPDGGWVVQVSESSDAPVRAGNEAIAIGSGGVATSSTAVRRWRRGTVELHHIVDPATGLPASGPWRTVTCVAGSCLDANIAATAAIVRGEDAVAWLTERGLPSRLVDGHGAAVRTQGWPQSAP
jgi:thiamine biosynthesis lipoprotein ApbE